MICNGNCFECEYDDCIRESDPVKKDRHDYYVRNRERIIANVVRWKKEHPDRVRENNRKAYQRNKVKRDRKEYMHQYYLKKKKERMMQG